MKFYNTIQKWVTIGVVEVLMSLILISIAPVFLNSDKPMIGFLIWFAVPTILGGSGFYVALRITDAKKARKLFISKFPEYFYLGITDFLELPYTHIATNLEMLEAAKNDPEFQTLNVSLLDLLHGAKKP
ncbi:MAG: hypothetical protein AB4426_11875 [Xenococcaceae cyanobacterium]